MANSTIIRLVIAIDDTNFRDHLKLILSNEPFLELLGEANDGQQLIELVEQKLPDVLVISLSMPGMDGIEVARILSNRFPALGVIGLSLFDEEHLMLDMLKAGAKGLLQKNAQRHEVAEAIHTVCEGNPYYCRSTNAKLSRLIAKEKNAAYQSFAKDSFNERELEIIRLICLEYTNREIGEKLFLSVRTVEGYRQRILTKMQVKNSAGLVVYAIQHGFFQPK